MSKQVAVDLAEVPLSDPQIKFLVCVKYSSARVLALTKL